ncbi:pentapeptide repeat-containing protein, partial [Rhodococcus aetherivorans]
MSNRADENLWVDRLVAAARSGATLDLSAGARAEHYNPATVGNWTVDRSIPATAIRRVLVDDHGKFDPRGLRIQGARITGTSTFTHVKFDYPLHFRRCVIDQPIDLRYSKFSELSFDRSHIKTLNMEGAAIGTLLAAGLRADGEIRLLGARIEGPLVLEDAILQNPGKSVLTLDRTTATAGLCAPGLRTEGMISALGARIEGPLVLQDAILQNPGKSVLTLDRTTATAGLCAPGLRTE